MGVSTDFRREIENKVIGHSNYFAVPDSQWVQHIKTVNPEAMCFPLTFPTIEPRVDNKTKKLYDFVFFAGTLSKNKGTNDVVSALELVAKKHPEVTLNIIGSADENYMDNLHQQIIAEGIEKNVILTSSFPIREDVFKQIAKAKCAVLPGITASLNSTVREAMLMGMPTITYETPDTIQINQKTQCILTAKMEDIEDLAVKMGYALTFSKDMSAIAYNGENYAQKHFSQEAFNNSFDGILRKVVDL